MAGFASSIFIPLTGWLTADRGWRTTVLILGGMLALTTVPLHAFAVRRTAPRLGATAVYRAWPRRVLRIQASGYSPADSYCITPRWV